MKMNLSSQKTVASEGLQMTRMGVDEKSMDLIVSYLRDKIYSDKILAPIREYICNAMDSMVEANNTTDTVLVELKKVGESWIWSVRDYGFGLNDDDITNIFGCYGASRKRHTNDQVGSYGIGSGSAFAYGDSFYVTSYHKGIKSSYVCTLGRGENGVSVGEIYRVSQEPTNETGIEVSFEVKHFDVPYFRSKSLNFVTQYEYDKKLKFIYTPSSIYDQADETIPTKPINTKVVDEFVLNQYEQDTSLSKSTQYKIRMGGVVYPYKNSNVKHRNHVHPIIIDVPIGTLTIPISRESIENTPLNDKVFQRIENELDKLEQEEISNITVPKFGYVNSGKYSKSKVWCDQWFTYDFTKCFPKTHMWSYRVGKLYDENDKRFTGEVSESANGKYSVYLIPGIKNPKNWHKRLSDSLKGIYGDKYSGYLYMSKPDYDKMMLDLDNSIDISDCIFIDVKSLKLPKLQSNKNESSEKYRIYHYTHNGFYSPEELNDLVGDIDDSEWHTKVENFDELNKRTIASSKEYGITKHKLSYYTTGSNKMITSMVNLGWLTPDSEDYLKAKERIVEHLRQKRLITNTLDRLSSIYFGEKNCNPLVKKHIEKYPDKIKKIEDRIDSITKENSTRGKLYYILKSRYYTYTEYHLSRQDIRKILNNAK